MAEITTSYDTGTIAVASGSAAVAGVGTFWNSAAIRPGDLFCAVGLSIRISAVTSQSALTLAFPWPLASLPAGSAYEIRYVDDAIRQLSTLNDVLTKINLPEDWSEEAGEHAAAAAASAAAASGYLEDVTDQAEAADASAGAAAGSATAASGSASAASGSASAAAGAAMAAETAEDQAAGHAAAAGLARTGSEGARDTALGYRNTALTAKDDAVAAKTASEGARDTALIHRNDAQAAKAAAEGARDTASGHATTATTKAGEATGSATTAGTKATEASNSAAEALGYRNAASTHATNAGNAKTAAEAARDQAVAAKNAAEAAADSIADGPVTSVAGNTGTVTTAQLVASGLAPAAHSHSTAQVTGLDSALGAKAPLASPAFSGAPTAPTAAVGTNTTQLATMAAIQAAIANLINSAPGALDTLDELAAAMGDDPNFAATVTNALAGKQALSNLLTAIAGLSANGLVVRTGAGSSAARAIDGTTDLIGVTNGDAVAGNPTITVGAKVMRTDTENQAVTGGATVTSKSLGTASGTLTLDVGDCPLQHYTNNGAHTLAPGSTTGAAMIDVTNGASAGAVTTSGWSKVEGAFTTTNGQKFRCHCSVGQAGSLLIIQAMQ